MDAAKGCAPSWPSPGARDFSRAAESWARPSPRVSQAIAALEQEVGQPLFIREGRTTHLAPAGKLLLEHAQVDLRRDGAGLRRPGRDGRAAPG